MNLSNTSEKFVFFITNEIFAKSYFWRTYTGAELDYVEEINGRLSAFEIKFKKARKKAPKSWIENYGNQYQCITYDNIREFVV